MLKLFTSLVFFLLARLSAAQFAAYPSCVQPLLYSAFPASCLSLSLAVQNTCLCKDANAFASASVTAIYQQCGCADLKVTVQLTEAYCSQVGVDVGPAFSVFTRDNTPCGGSTGSGAGTATGGAKGSDANKGLVIGQIVEIVVGVTGGILALWW
jgi:hypothetical protein